MKMIFLILILFNFTSFADDLYQNYDELKKDQQEGTDYRILAIDRGFSSSIFAIHGGYIESGTSELAKAIGLNSMNLYLFEAIRIKDSFSLHITSTHFDEPQALKLASFSRNCLSIHGFKEDTLEAVCVGGGDYQRAKTMAGILHSTFPDIEIIFPCLKYPGSNPLNIVNRCLQQGVQLELSGALRNRLLKNDLFLDQLAKVIRDNFLNK